MNPEGCDDLITSGEYSPAFLGNLPPIMSLDDIYEALGIYPNAEFTETIILCGSNELSDGEGI